MPGTAVFSVTPAFAHLERSGYEVPRRQTMPAQSEQRRTPMPLASPCSLPLTFRGSGQFSYLCPQAGLPVPRTAWLGALPESKLKRRHCCSLTSLGPLYSQRAAGSTCAWRCGSTEGEQGQRDCPVYQGPPKLWLALVCGKGDSAAPVPGH